MNVSIQQLANHLSYYLRLAGEGAIVVVTSQDKPVAQIEPLSENANLLRDAPLVQWASDSPRLTRSVPPPKIEGESLADWIVRNRG